MGCLLVLLPCLGSRDGALLICIFFLYVTLQFPICISLDPPAHFALAQYLDIIYGFTIAHTIIRVRTVQTR